MHATIPKGNMGYDQYTVPNDCSCRTYFCCFPLALANTFSWPFVPILSNFFGEQGRQNHPQYLSGLSRALFPTTFLETAVYKSYLSIYLSKVGELPAPRLWSWIRRIPRKYPERQQSHQLRVLCTLWLSVGEGRFPFFLLYGYCNFLSPALKIKRDLKQPRRRRRWKRL